MDCNLQKPCTSRQTIARYALGGVAFGFCFPVVALAVDAFLLRADPVGLVELLRANPIHMIVGTAPIVLGTVFLFLGISRRS